jgi:hypothetical protein
MYVHGDLSNFDQQTEQRPGFFRQLALRENMRRMKKFLVLPLLLSCATAASDEGTRPITLTARQLNEAEVIYTLANAGPETIWFKGGVGEPALKLEWPNDPNRKASYECWPLRWIALPSGAEVQTRDSHSQLVDEMFEVPFRPWITKIRIRDEHEMESWVECTELEKIDESDWQKDHG